MHSRPGLATRLSATLSRRSVVPVGLFLTLVIGLGDRATGVELPFTMLYLLPIGLAVWFRDSTFAVLLSAISSVCIGGSLVHDRMSGLGIAWNLGGAVILFLAATWAVDQLHAYVERERHQRRMAVDQLRHAERLNVIGTLAAGVAHEMGTPLTVIAGCAEILSETSTDTAVHRRTTMIQEQVAKVSAIIRHLLDFGHRGGATRANVDLHALAIATCDMLQSTATKQHARLEVERGEPVPVTGNVAELQQVVSNLVINGLQAMARGGRIRIITSTTERDGRRVGRIAVEDQGPGIAPEHLGRIFDPFFTTKGVGEGTGLGLSVSYGIVQDHDGTIDVTSVPQRGSTFTVILPLAD